MQNKFFLRRFIGQYYILCIILFVYKCVYIISKSLSCSQLPKNEWFIKSWGGGFKFKHSNEANKSLEIVSLFDLQAAFGIFSMSGFFFFYAEQLLASRVYHFFKMQISMIKN